MAPEFPIPTHFLDGPVVAGIYMPRVAFNRPTWFVIAESTTPGEYNACAVRDDGVFLRRWWDIPGCAEALDRIHTYAVRWRNTIEQIARDEDRQPLGAPTNT